MFNKYIVGLDIGSSKVAAAAAVVRNGHIAELYFEAAKALGIKRGSIIDLAEAVKCVGVVLKKLRVKSGINFKFVYLNISGQDIISRHSHGIIPLAERGKKIITSQDIQKVNEQASILGANIEEEIIQRIPFSYKLDSGDDILNPLGLYSHKLELDLYLISSRISAMQNLKRLINQAGYEVKGTLLSGLATAQIVFDKTPKKGIDILCDIGSDFTEILVFKDGLLRDIRILLIGDNDLTAQLSVALKIPWDLAEDIKRSYGLVGDLSGIAEDKEVLIKKESFYQPIKQRLIGEILTEKARVLCVDLKEAIEKFIVGTEINSFVVCGRTALLEGFIEMLEKSLSTPLRFARITDAEINPLLAKYDLLAGQKYLTYLTALGIIRYVLSDYSHAENLTLAPSGNFFLRAINKIKEIYQEYF